MRIYFDNCCFNRPFDDQLQIRVRLESEAKLEIQGEIRAGKIEVVWSYVLDFENANNPYRERQQQINDFKHYAVQDIEETSKILAVAESIMNRQIHQMDALHLACAIISNCDYFLTTDDKILNKSENVGEITIVDPIVFIIEELSR